MISKIIEKACLKSDTYDIVDAKYILDRKYLSISDHIFTDGELNYDVNEDGYITIKEVKNANYILFIDQNKEIHLGIYKFIPENKINEIMYEIDLLTYLNIEKNNNEDTEVTDQVNINDDAIININKFLCTECYSNDKMVFTRSKSNPEILCTKCKNCLTEYNFVPSKYYKMSSKKIIYKKENTSRFIEIE